MSALESLSNPLERLATLPTGVQARGAAGDITWDAGLQYYRNDIVISPITGGAYIFTGGTNERSAILGGTDPALDIGGLWTRLQGNGVSSVDVFTLAAPVVGAAGSVALPAGASILAPEGSTWSITAQGGLTQPLASTAADFATLTFTGNGVGGTVGAVQVAPRIGATAGSFGVSATVFVGVGGTAITATCPYAGQIPTLTALRLTYVRLA